MCYLVPGPPPCPEVVAVSYIRPAEVPTLVSVEGDAQVERQNTIAGFLTIIPHPPLSLHPQIICLCALSNINFTCHAIVPWETPLALCLAQPHSCHESSSHSSCIICPCAAAFVQVVSRTLYFIVFNFLLWTSCDCGILHMMWIDKSWLVTWSWNTRTISRYDHMIRSDWLEHRWAKG